MKKLLLSFLFLSFLNLYSQEGEIIVMPLISPETPVNKKKQVQLREHIATLTIGLKNSNDKAYFYQSRAFAYILLQEYIAAISDYSKLIEMDADDAESYFLRGLGKQYSQKYFAQSSCDDYRKAKELNYQKVNWNTLEKIVPTTKMTKPSLFLSNMENFQINFLEFSL